MIEPERPGFERGSAGRCREARSQVLASRVDYFAREVDAARDRRAVARDRELPDEDERELPDGVPDPRDDADRVLARRRGVVAAR
jgi:hypothetical protein